MAENKRWLIAFLIAALIGSLTVSVIAQAQSNGTLTFGQPLPSQIAAGQTLNYDYVLTEPRQITLQALGDTAQPTITILRDGKPVAQQPNAEGALTVSLSTLLDAGSYVVQVAAANNTAGLLVLVLQAETPITAAALTLGSPLDGTVNPDAPLSLYRFEALTEPAFLYIESASPQSGVSVRIVNTTSGEVSGQIGLDLLGARLRIAAGSAAYQVEVHHSGSPNPEAFTICLAPVSAGGCESGSVQATEAPGVQLVATPEILAPELPQFCTATPRVAGGVNIRQSASANAIIVGNLSDGTVADVIGISPDSQFYNVLYRGTNGWIALSVVATSGDCSLILVINPPPVIAAPTQPPAPAQLPTQPAPSGPCLITMTGDQFIYTQPNAIPDYLFDQVHAGYELFPVGRLADNSWWKTNYYDAWIQTSTFGSTATVSGDCRSLPILAS